MERWRRGAVSGEEGLEEEELLCFDIVSLARLNFGGGEFSHVRSI